MSFDPLGLSVDASWVADVFRLALRLVSAIKKRMIDLAEEGLSFRAQTIYHSLIESWFMVAHIHMMLGVENRNAVVLL